MKNKTDYSQLYLEDYCITKYELASLHNERIYSFDLFRYDANEAETPFSIRERYSWSFIKKLLGLGFKVKVKMPHQLLKDTDQYECELVHNTQKIRATYRSENNGLEMLTLYYTESMYRVVIKLVKDFYKLYEVSDNKENMHPIYILGQGYAGLRFTKKKFILPTVDITQNYNDSILDVENTIIENTKKSEGGLYLFYGIPGTGKTTYIKQLIPKLGVNVYYISSNMVELLDTPDFITVLTSCPRNSVFVLEDAERAIQKREGTDSRVSTLLNLTDGFLSGVFNFSFIVTFNSDFDVVDNAIMRKGRCKKMYEFDKLCQDKTKNLMIKLYGEGDYKDESLTLADIYNYYSDNNTTEEKENKRVGFII